MKKLLIGLLVLIAAAPAEAQTLFPQTPQVVYTQAQSSSWIIGGTSITVPANLSPIAPAAGMTVRDNITQAFVGVVSAYNAATGAITLSAPGAKSASSSTNDRLAIGVFQGTGCSTMFYRDPLCKGVGVGMQSGGTYYLTSSGTVPYQSVKMGNMPDPDPLDPGSAANPMTTTANWETKWCGGVDPCPNADMQAFLEAEKGLTAAQVSRVFYLSQSGSPSTTGAQCENNPSTPCQSLAPIFNVVDDDQGGVIVIRGGNWTGATVSGFISGTTLYAAAFQYAFQYVEPGSTVTGTGVTAGTTVSNQTWHGGPVFDYSQQGIYPVNNSQTVGSFVLAPALSTWNTTTNPATITIASGLSIGPGTPIYDLSTSFLIGGTTTQIGTVGSYSGTTLTFTGKASQPPGFSAQNSTTASATWSAGATTISTAGVTTFQPGAPVYDTTSNTLIGTALSYNAGTITLQSPALAGGTNGDALLVGNDVLIIGNPVTLTIGTVPNLNFNPNSFNQGNPGWTFTGSPGKPLYIMAYPGETVNADSPYIDGHPYDCCATVDGLNFRYPFVVGPASGNNVLEWEGFTDLVLINDEIAGSDKTLVGYTTLNATFNNDVLHDQAAHSFYTDFGNAFMGSGFSFGTNQQTCSRAGQTPNYPGEQCAGYYLNFLNTSIYNSGSDGFEPAHVNNYLRHVVIEGNTIAYNGGTGIGFQTAIGDVTVKNNLIFDNVDAGITPALAVEHGGCTTSILINHLDIENNLVWEGLTTDTIRTGNNPQSAIWAKNSILGLCPNTRIGNFTIKNNLMVTDNITGNAGAPTLRMEEGSNPSTWVVAHNTFASNSGTSNPLTDYVALISTSASTTALASFTTASTILCVPSGLNIGIASQTPVFDSTVGATVGTVSNYTGTCAGGTTLTLNAAAAVNSSGSSDSLIIGSADNNLSPGTFSSCNAESGQQSRCYNLSQFQALTVGSASPFNNNQYVSSPDFTDASTGYLTAPYKFNFMLQNGSPACGYGPAWLSGNC